LSTAEQGAMQVCVDTAWNEERGNLLYFKRTQADMEDAAAMEFVMDSTRLNTANT